MIGTPEFSECDHAYSYRGIRLMSVTQILRATGMMDTRWYRPDHAEVGTAVHAATALSDLGTLDEESVDPVVRPYLDTWRTCVAATGMACSAVERRAARLSDPAYAGTIDRIATMQGHDWIVDIKTGSPAPWHPMQLIAYAGLYAGEAKLGLVYLTTDSWALKTVAPDDRLRATWHGAVRVAAWIEASKRRSYD